MYLCHISNFHRNINRKHKQDGQTNLIAFSNPARFQTGNMQAADQPAKRPNIILFRVDDMGWEDTSLPFWTEKTL